MTKHEVNKLISSQIMLIDDVYLGNKYKHNWKCNCGNIIEGKTWDKIKNKGFIMCANCNLLKRKKLHKERVDEVGDYEYIDSYFRGDILPDGLIVKRESYIKVKHKYCSSTYIIESNRFFNSKQRCTKCCKKYEKSFAYYIEVELGEPLEKYWDFEKNIVNPYHISRSSTKEKIWIKCQSKSYHGSFETSCSSFINSSKYITKGCSYCMSKKVHPKDSFAQYHIDNTDPNFLEKYWDYEKNTLDPWKISNGNGRKIWIKCQEKESHGSYETRVDSFKKNHRCGKCHNFGNDLYDSFGYHNFDKVMSWHPDNEISPFRIRKRSDKQIKFICEECGSIFQKSLNKVSKGQWCPTCSKSKGEKVIIDILYKNNILFIHDEPYFKDLLSDKGNPLRPDFILPDYKIWIEYDGEFHYKKIYEKDSFDILQIHDKRKDKYAKKHGWKLIRIPYWEFDNIENILNKEII